MVWAVHYIWNFSFPLSLSLEKLLYPLFLVFSIAMRSLQISPLGFFDCRFTDFHTHVDFRLFAWLFLSALFSPPSACLAPLESVCIFRYLELPCLCRFLFSFCGFGDRSALLLFVIWFYFCISLLFSSIYISYLEQRSLNRIFTWSFLFLIAAS